MKASIILSAMALSLMAFSASAGETKGTGQRTHKPNRGEYLKRFDTNGDGQLSADEKQAAREQFKEKHPEMAERYQELIKQFDKDGDGKLNEEERAALKQYMQEHRQEKGTGKGGQTSPTSGHREEILKRFDKNGDGKLDEEEKAAAMEALKQFRENHKKE